MRKKLWSIIMAVVMLLTMIPVQQVQALESTSTFPFGYSYPGWDDQNMEYVENTDAPMYSDGWSGWLGYTYDLFMYYNDGTTKTKLTAADLTSSDESVLKLEAGTSRGDMVQLIPVSCGTATISYMVGDQAYSIEATVTLPDMGFYKALDVTEENFIREFTVTETENTIYLISQYGTFESFTMSAWLAEIATATLSADKTYLTVTVTGTPRDGRWYDISATLMDAAGNYYNQNANIALKNGKPELVLSWPDWNSGAPSYNADSDTQNYLNIAKGIPNEAYVMFIEGDTQILLTAADLVSSDENIVRVYESEEYPEVTVIDGANCGEATLSYTYTNAAGVSATYDIDINVTLPSVGFYTTTTAAESSYIQEFTVTETENVFYLVSTEGTIESVPPNAILDAIATVEISADKTYATVTVTGTPSGNYWYSTEVVLGREDGSTWNDYANLQLINGKPALMYRWADYDNGIVEDTSGRLDMVLDSNPGNSSDVFFYFVENGVETNICAADLQVVDNSVVTIAEQSENAKATRVEFVGFGNTTISYTNPATNKTYSVDVTVELPDVGFYSSAVASQSTYISDFTVTATADTIYVVPTSGILVTDVELMDGFENIATVTVAADGTYATVQITGAIDNGRNYGARVYGTYADSTNTFSHWADIELYDSRPALKFRWANMGQDGIPYEDTSFSLMNNLEITISQNEPVYFYFVNDGAETKLELSKLSSSDENVVSVTTYAGSDAIILEPADFGTAQICYTENGKTYTVDVNVTFPYVGAYKVPVLAEENYCPEFTVTDEDNVFYLLQKNGEKIVSVELLNGLEDIASVDVSSDGSYATVTVSGTPANCYYNFRVECEGYNGSTWSYWGDVYLKNGEPYIALCWPEPDADHGEFHTVLDTAKGYATDVWIYFVEGDTETKLAITDLKSSDESVVKIVDPGYDDGMVTLVTTGWGDAKVSYTVNGKEYSLDVVSELQMFGYYSTEERTKEGWILEYTVSDDNNTFWFIANDGLTFAEVTPSAAFADIADFVMSTSATCVMIQVHSTPVEGENYSLKFVAYDVNGSEIRGSHSLELTGEISPKIDVEIGELPTVDASKPVEDTVVGVDGEEAKTELADNANEVLTQIQDAVESGDGSAAQDKLSNKVSSDVADTVADALENGADLKLNTYLEAETLTDEQLEAVQDDINKMQQIASNANLVQVLDLTVKMEVYVDGQLATTGSMYELNDSIVFTAVLPESVKNEINNVPAGGELILYVLYVHDGAADRIDDVTINAEGSISFPAKLFSTYALAYEHKAPEPEVIETTPMYRLYNPNSGEHFYTGSVEERDMLDEAGWTYEGVAWNAPIYIGDPVHRVFNPNSGDHHYTMSQEEVDMLVAAGWQYEGVAWNSAPATHPEAVAQQRLYNPNADCGSHHYTSSEEELNNLVELGWIHEGMGWFGLLK